MSFFGHQHGLYSILQQKIKIELAPMFRWLTFRWLSFSKILPVSAKIRIL